MLELYEKTVDCQANRTKFHEFDAGVLRHILQQAAATAGETRFAVGRSIRVYRFEPGETYFAPTAIGRALDVSPQRVRRALSRLRAAGAVSVVSFAGWSVVRPAAGHDATAGFCGTTTGFCEPTAGICEPTAGNGRRTTANQKPGFRIVPTVFHPTGGRPNSAGLVSLFFVFVFVFLRTIRNTKDRRPLTFSDHAVSEIVNTPTRPAFMSQPDGRPTIEVQAMSKQKPQQQQPKRKPATMNANTKTRLVDTDVLEENDAAVLKLTWHTAAELKRNPAFKKLNVDKLLELNDALADLPAGILFHRPRKGLIARSVFAKWREIHSPKSQRAVLKDFVLDVDAVVDAVRSAKMIHGQRYFIFEWLLSFARSGYREDLTAEANLGKMLSGKFSEVPEWLAKERAAIKNVNYKTCEDFDPK